MLVLAGRAVAEPPPGEVRDREKPLTAFAAGPFRRADLVVVAEVVDVRNARGLVTARIRPEEVLSGVDVEGTLTILVKGPRPTLDPSAPSLPYLSEDARGRYVFFLAQRPEGVGYFLLTLVDALGRVGAEKVEAARAHAELARIESYEERALETLEYLLGVQKKGGTWTRVNAARELNHLAGVRPDLFDSRVRQRVRTLGRGSQIPQQRRWLARLLENLEGMPLPEEEDADAAVAVPPTSPLAERLRRAEDKRACLESFLHQGGRRALPVVLAELPTWEDPDLRVWMVTTLAEGGYRLAAPRIRGLYAHESEAKVLQAIVRAVGLLGTGADVSWLEARLANPRVYREVCFALARLRTNYALAVLRRERARATGGEADDDLVALLDYLQSPAFVQVEERAGRRIGPSDRR